MRNGPAFQLYARDFYAGTTDLTAEEMGLYIRGILWSWDNGPLPLEEARRARACLCTIRELRRCWPALSQLWLRGNDGFTNRRLETEREKQQSFREKQANYGHKGASKRWGSPLSEDGVAHFETIGSGMASDLRSSSSDLDLRIFPGSELPQDPKSDGHGKGARAVEPVWTNGTGRHHGSSLAGSHVRCFHAPAACARGLCVPQFLGQQWSQQLHASAEQGAVDVSHWAEQLIGQFVADSLAAVPPGPIGDDPIKFWRAAWSNRHGSQAPAPAEPKRETKGSRMAAAALEAERLIAARTADV